MPTGYDLGDLNIDINVGGKIAVKTGATLDIESGGALKLAGTQVTANAAELNLLDGVDTLITDIVGDITFTINDEAANVRNIDVQLKDMAATNMAQRVMVYWWLSDDSAGDGISGTAPDGGVAIGTNGVEIVEVTAELTGFAWSSATGALDFDITESGADTWYLGIAPFPGAAEVSGAITFA